MAATQTAGAPAFQTFAEPPASYFLKKVQEHVAATGCPETFPGLHPGPISKDEPFAIIGPIGVPREKRPNGDLAPCPMCQPNKFLDGKLVWFKRIAAVAVIGHCCANKEHLVAAQREYEARQALERAQDVLMREAPLNPGRLASIGEILPVAEHAQQVFEAFRRDGGWYHRALRDVTRSSGRLVITTEYVAVAGAPIGMRTSGGTMQTRDLDFGPLWGRRAVAAEFQPADQLKAAAALLEGLSASDEEEALELTVALTEEERIEAAAALESAVRSVKQVRKELGEFRRFFLPANLRRITTWGTHPETPYPMLASIEQQKGSRLFEIWGRMAPRCSIAIDEVLWRPIEP